jgi:sulfoxide reductase heme-binding subunit YedZ
MTSHLAWYVARASGILAWCLMSAAVIWGLLLSTRLMNRRPSPKWLLDLHRFLGGLAVSFAVIHIAGLVGDNYLDFGRADVLVPLASQWRPTAVALGVVSLWLLAAVEVTSLLMRYLPRRRWHQVHLASYAVFWLATLHALRAGTDTRNGIYTFTTYVVIVVVVFLSVLRALQPRKPSRGGAPPRVAANRPRVPRPSARGR